MKVFENVDMEFFDPIQELPEDRELVVLVLKDNVLIAPHMPSDYYKKHLAFAVVKIFKTVEPRFIDSSNYYRRTYWLKDIKCWGRVKGEIKFEGEY